MPTGRLLLVNPDGTVIDPYYVREHAGFAVVFAVTPNDEVVFARQYKHGFGDFVLELPAGAIEVGESPLACAERLLNENGAGALAVVNDAGELVGLLLRGRVKRRVKVKA